MISIGYYKELKLYDDTGSLKDNIQPKANYNKKAVIDYLNRQKKIAGCPKTIINPLTGREIVKSFFVYTDGIYEWGSFLPFFIRKYNVKLPQELIDRATNEF